MHIRARFQDGGNTDIARHTPRSITRILDLTGTREVANSSPPGMHEVDGLIQSWAFLNQAFSDWFSEPNAP